MSFFKNTNKPKKLMRKKNLHKSHFVQGGCDTYDQEKNENVTNIQMGNECRR